VAKAWDGFYRADGGTYPDYDTANEIDKQIDEQRRWRANSRYMLEAEGLDVGSDYTVAYHTHVDLTTWENRAGEGGEIGVSLEREAGRGLGLYLRSRGQHAWRTGRIRHHNEPRRVLHDDFRLSRAYQ